MQVEMNADEATVAPIVEKLLLQEREAVFSFRTDTRKEYDLLFNAAEKGEFPELLSITHRGLRLKKRHVHAPPRSAEAA